MSDEFRKAKRSLKQRLIDELPLEYDDGSYCYMLGGRKFAGERLDIEPMQWAMMVRDLLPEYAKTIDDIIEEMKKERPWELVLTTVRSVI